jgi:hypothetical protein
MKRMVEALVYEVRSETKRQIFRMPSIQKTKSYRRRKQQDFGRSLSEM